MTIGVLHERGVANRAIARTLGITEGTVRYRIRQLREKRPDGRRKTFRVESLGEVVAHWMAGRRASGVNLAELYELLATEHGYAGSLRSVQRYVERKYPRPRLRSRRRVETPPGAQAQVDWAEFRGVRVADVSLDLYAFYFVLSHSRMDAVVWSERKDELAWLTCHNDALRRIGGVPAVLRVDNEKTAVSRGAGPRGVVNEAYAAYSRAVRFHVDASRPRCPGDKGKVERQILDGRRRDPRHRSWSSLEELQGWSDTQTLSRAKRRLCPATGLSVWESYLAEREWLGDLPILPEPFDVVATRPVDTDATVRFEGRAYSVPFGFAEQVVEVRGCARSVQVWADGEVVAEHPRHTRSRLVIDPAHYEGEDTDHVVAPVPLGRMGRRLQEIADMPPAVRPIDLYAALAEVAR